jgi:hypothetical protein
MQQMTMEDALALIGLSHATLEAEYQKVPPGPEMWPQRVTVYQETVKRHHKQAMLAVHPDRCKDADATERCAQINWAVGELLKLRPSPPPPPRPVPVFFNSWSMSQTSSTTTIFQDGPFMTFTFRVG